jgi:hypothetical protein
MAWSNALFLTLVLLLCIVVQARIERKWWFIGLGFFVLPVLGLAGLWTVLTRSWAEAGLALALAAAIGGVWWWRSGRFLLPADSSGIKVWGQDAAPRPKAALQAEIDTLKQEKEQLEAELRRLKNGDT